METASRPCVLCVGILLGAFVKMIYQNKMFCSGLVMIVTGVAFIVLENTYYQYVDENGVLRESLFLPLGALCFGLGWLLLLICFIRAAWRCLKRSR